MKQNKLRWGVLGAAKIAVTKVIPAIQKSRYGIVTALATRDVESVIERTQGLGIGTFYGSYEELIEDPDIDAIYIPLPNHLHVPFTIKSAEAGKHVLCEKPIALNAREASQLIDVRDRTGVQILEAFMVRTNPVWLKAKELLDSGRIGKLRSVIGNFSYMNTDPDNVRNKPEWGGGGLMDVGCYLIMASRYYFGREPVNVSGFMQKDAAFGTDVLTSAILDFVDGQAVFSCGTKSVPAQLLHLEGTNGRIRFEIPFSPAPDSRSKLYIDDHIDLTFKSSEVIEFEAFDQYTLQADAFAESVFDGIELPMTLEDSIANMKVIDSIIRK